MFHQSRAETLSYSVFYPILRKIMTTIIFFVHLPKYDKFITLILKSKFGHKTKTIRSKQNLLLREIAQLNKIERGERQAKREPF